MLKQLAAASIAMGSASAISIEKVWTTVSVAPKAPGSYIGPTVSPSHDSRTEAAFSKKRQFNNVWRPYRPWLNKYRGKWNHGRWVQAEDRVNDGYRGDPSRGYGRGLTKRFSYQKARGYGNIGGPKSLYGVLQARYGDRPYVSYQYRDPKRYGGRRADLFGYRLGSKRQGRRVGQTHPGLGRRHGYGRRRGHRGFGRKNRRHRGFGRRNNRGRKSSRGRGFGGYGGGYGGSRRGHGQRNFFGGKSPSHRRYSRW